LWGCPCKRYDNGGGYIEPFNICDKFNIEIFNLKKIHKDCRLDDAKED